MQRNKLVIGSAVLCAGMTILLCTTFHCKPATNARQSAASLSQGRGSSGNIAHTTWTQYGGGADQSKYVELEQIDKNNVNQLTQAWFYSTNDNVSWYKFNPVIVDSIMYVLAKNNSLVAIHAATGREIWIHANLNLGSKRGINYWESKDRKERRLIFCINNTLQAIDAMTGKSIRDFADSGYVDLRQGLDRDPAAIGRAMSTSPGHVFDDLIILGSSPGESLFSAPGYVRAYNVLTGKLAWTFHTIPHPGEHGYDSWPKDAYKYIGGVNCWGEITVDEQRGIAYIPLGSPTYDYYGGDRPGNGLYGNCILALDARTGKKRWHFQTVHHDLWDFDLAAAPQLITVQHNNKNIDAVAVATKQGFLFVFDRETGEPVWPIEERKVATSTVPGEVSSPTQPFQTVLPPFTRQRMTTDDISPYLPPQQQELWKKRVAAANSELFYPLSDTSETITMPGANGGAIYGNTAANPAKGIVYIAAMEKPSVYKLKKDDPAEVKIPLSDKDTMRANATYIQYCSSCHGANKAGLIGPALENINTRLTYDNFYAVVSVGKGQMPSFLHIGDKNLANLYKYLSNTHRRQAAFIARVSRMSAPSAIPDGPVVDSGGAPLPQELKTRRGGFGRGTLTEYPEGIEKPRDRYVDGSQTAYGLGHPDVISPPWSTVVAYDLNTASIKWRRPLGKVDSLGGAETGLPSGSQGKGMIVTATGLVFATCADGRVYAYDEDDGKMLWSTMLPRVPEGLPAMYEYEGRQYLVVSATGAVIDKHKSDAQVPRGYVVFALPKK